MTEDRTATPIRAEIHRQDVPQTLPSLDQFPGLVGFRDADHDSRHCGHDRRRIDESGGEPAESSLVRGCDDPDFALDSLKN
jgi:hypothetical protein